MSIQYVQFIAEVSVGGNHNAISYWNREKHGATIDIEEKGSWIVLVLKAPVDVDKDGNITLVPTGQVRRVPITNVAYIGETREAPTTSKGKGL